MLAWPPLVDCQRPSWQDQSEECKVLISSTITTHSHSHSLSHTHGLWSPPACYPDRTQADKDRSSVFSVLLTGTRDHTRPIYGGHGNFPGQFNFTSRTACWVIKQTGPPPCRGLFRGIASPPVLCHKEPAKYPLMDARADSLWHKIAG